MKKNFHFITTVSSVVVLTIASALGLQIALGATWQGPGNNPPNGNVDAPLNIGGDSQYKTGELELRGRLKIHGPGTASSILNTNNSGLTIDANNSGVADVIIYESSMRMSNGKDFYLNNSEIKDLADTTVNIGEDVAVAGAINAIGGDICTDQEGGHCLTDLGSIGSTYWTASGNDIYNNNSGNVGIGMTNPSEKLDVAGWIRSKSSAGVLKLAETDNSNVWWLVADSNYFSIRKNNEIGYPLVIDNNKNVGIGTASPSERLDVLGEIHATEDICTDAGGGVCLSTEGGTGGGYWDASGNDIYNNNSGNVGIGTDNPNNLLDLGTSLGKKLAVYQSGDDFYGLGISASTLEIHADSTAVENPGMVLKSSGNVGIGTTNPSSRLDIAGDIETTGVNVAANTRSSHFNTDGTFYRYSGQVYITVDDNLYIRDTDGSTKIHFNTNQGKLTIDLIDPLYDINGEKFATYMAAMTGVQEETTGKVNLRCQNNQCVKIIDFDDAEKGSDLWLFYQVTDFGNDWENLVALLTPEGKNNVWYEVNSDKNQLLIYGENEGRVSYRLTAPRFDHQKWSNISAEKGINGMRVELKN